MYSVAKDLLETHESQRRNLEVNIVAMQSVAEAMFPEMPDEYFTRVTVTLKEGELLVQQGFEFVGKDESGCLWRKKKTYEDVVKEREISENSQNLAKTVNNPT